jgi:choline dehydrogenase-like flavoprotein
MENHDVIIIGAGPAGLSAAIRLRELGVKDVVVLERESEAGGVPHYCGHFGFGWENNRRLTTGPKFAAQLVTAAQGIDIRTSTTVLEFTMRNSLRVHSAKGISDMSAKRVILATGMREQSRAAQLIGGNRLQGVMNTGTLQQHVYLKNQKPFSNPVIIGNEWVTYSALMTCRHAGIKPFGILAEEALDTPWFFPLAARLRYGVRTHRKAKLLDIHGQNSVEAVTFQQDDTVTTMSCDGVILSGKFVPELSLLHPSPVGGRWREATKRFTLNRLDEGLAASGQLEGTKFPPPGQALIRPSGTFSQREKGEIMIIGNARGHINTAGRCVIEARAAAETLAKELA